MEIQQTLINNGHVIYQKSHSVSYEIKDEKVFIVEAQDHFIQRSLRKLHFKIPEKTYLELDEYGSFIFQQINGKTDVYTLGQKLVERYKETEQNLFERLTLYLEFLEKNKKYIFAVTSNE